MAKTRAYTSELGNHQVSADAVGKIRNLHFNGQPTGERYFSTHRAGHRRPVKHVMKDNWFFAYIEGTGHASASDGETLNHILFKEALASVEHTKLSLYRLTEGRPAHWRDVPIRIKKAEIEKEIERTTAPPFRADLRLEFEDDLGLSLKWEGQLYVEVRHTHAIEADKQMELRDLEKPLVEIEIPSVFTYDTPDEQTSDDKEEAHKRRIRTILESQNGFLKCVILSDPSSSRYFQVVVKDLRTKVNALEKERIGLHESVAKHQSDLRASATKAVQLSLQLEDSLQALRAQTSAQQQKQLELQKLGQRVSELARHRTRLWVACMMLCFTLALTMIWRS